MTWNDEETSYRRSWMNVMKNDPDAALALVKKNINQRLQEGYVP